MRVGLSLKRPARGRIKKLDRRSKSPDQRIRCRVVLKLAAGQRCNPASDGIGLRPVDGGAHRGAVRSRLDNRLACAEGNREASWISRTCCAGGLMPDHRESCSATWPLPGAPPGA